jgi:class 3 adenylate cyclase
MLLASHLHSRAAPEQERLSQARSSLRRVSTPEPQLHERLRALLPSAEAATCRVIAIFLDIRGFSTFSEKGESFDTASYLSSVYSTVLTSHFPDADFFKPTGDGLLLIHELPADRAEVPHAVSAALARCVSLVNAFGQITAGDYMINFPVPQLLGAGVAHGTATRLVSGGLVLDYTGRCLNLAARLMDKARPSGVVFTDGYAEVLMAPEVAVGFSRDDIYVRGIAEEKPIPVYITTDVEITDADREPMTGSRRKWGTAQELTLAKVRENSGYGFHLPRAPRSYETAMVYVEFPTFDTQGEPEDSVSHLTIPGEVEEHPEGAVISISLQRVQDRLKDAPASITTKFLGRTKATKVTFRSFIEPAEGS